MRFYGGCSPKGRYGVGVWGPFMTRGWDNFSSWGGWAAFGPLGGRRRFFEQGEVRLAVLSLLKEGPKHGYELIKQFEVRSGGLYRASAGTVYPTLQLLEDEGLITSETVDGKKVYRITPEGEAELERESDTVDEIWGRAERWEEWSRWMGPQAFIVAGPLGHLVKEALKAAQAAGDSPERQQRVREILERARKELSSLGKNSAKD
ncbi:MAG TPA: PadR family transcriptional regulator [Thermoanaerobaculia bacterium]|nr:PadR family transcriptional regulator [Thermoanaerobaculia bacterium]